MIQRKCPKCKNLCDLTEDQISLGTVSCKCGARFEVLSAVPKREITPDASNTKKDTSIPEPKSVPVAKSDGPKSVISKEADRKIDWRFLRPFIFVIISLGIVYGLWLLNWTTALFLVSFITATLCWLAKRQEKKAHGVKTIRYFFLDKSLEFFVPLMLVVIFYTLLSWYIGWNNTDQTTIAALEGFQQQMDNLQTYLSWFRFKPWTAALIILGIILLDLFLSVFFSFRDLGAYYKYYSLWSKRVFTVVLLLCCFTFLGATAGEKRAELSSRIDKIADGYSKVRENASRMLTDAVQEKLFEKVQNSFPVEMRVAAYVKNIDDRLEKLRVSIYYANTAKVDVIKPSAVIADYETFSKEPINYAETAAVQPPVSPAKPPSGTSVESVGKVLNEVETKLTFKQKLASLIKSGGGKQLFCQFPKSFTNVLKSAALKGIVEKYPVLEPIVDVFVSTFDKTVEEKVNGATDRLAESIMKDPASVNKVVAEESQKIVDSTEVKVPPGDAEQIKKGSPKVQQKLSEIDLVEKNLQAETRTAVEAEGKRSILEGGRMVTGTCMCKDLRTQATWLLWGPTVMSEERFKMLCPQGGPC
jgi:hypothetical protein